MALQPQHCLSTLTCTLAYCWLVMLSAYRPCGLRLPIGALLRTPRCPTVHIACAPINQNSMTHELSSKSLLDDQSFGGDSLNRSVGDRRSETFVRSAFEGSSSLLVTGRSVLAKQRSSGSKGSSQQTELCWLSPDELKEYGIQPQTDSQTTVTGRSPLTC